MPELITLRLRCARCGGRLLIRYVPDQLGLRTHELTCPHLECGKSDLVALSGTAPRVLIDARASM